MVNFCAVYGCCTRTNIVGEHLEDTLRICNVSAMDQMIFGRINCQVFATCYIHINVMLTCLNKFR